MPRTIHTLEEAVEHHICPAVTGIVALIWEANENLTPLQIKRFLSIHLKDGASQAHRKLTHIGIVNLVTAW